MSKFNKIFIPLIFVLSATLVLFFGLSRLDVLPEISISDLISIPSFSFGETGHKKYDNSVVLAELKSEYISSQNSENEFSDNFRSVLFNINTDINIEGNITADSVKSSVYYDFDYLRNFVPDYVFIIPDENNTYFGLKNSDGTVFDVLEYTLSCVNFIGAKPVLVINESFIYDSNNNFDFSEVANLLTNYSFDKVLLSLNNGYFEQKFYDSIKFLKNKFDSEYPNVMFGAEVHAKYENSFTDTYADMVLSEKLIDFAYVDIDKSTLSQDMPFAAVAAYWNMYFEYFSVPCICEHRLDLIFTDDSEWAYGNEICLQLKALYNFPAFDGSCFNSVKSLKNKKSLARDLAIFLNDAADSVGKNISVKSLTPDNNSVVFTGSAGQDVSVFCNDEKLETVDGVFSVTHPLKTGENDFHFFGNGAEYSYSVINVSNLFYSYSNITQCYNSDTFVLSPFAVCPTDSCVYAVFEGYSYRMLPVTVDFTIPDGYSAYMTSIQLNSAINTQSALSLFCGYESFTDTLSCGTYSGNSNSDNAVLQTEEVSPFTNNGLGNSLMCMINWEKTEQISELGDYDTYHPDMSSLLIGTVDYINKITVSNEGYLRYELKSGINIYGTDAVIINNGYNLPLNKAVLTSFDDSAANSTRLTLKLDWLSPITITPEKNDYKKGYQSFSYNIDSFTSTYVDISLFYTDSIQFNTDMVFSSDSVFSSYELYKNEADNTLIIRLYLKQKGQFYGYTIDKNSDGNVEISFKKFIGNSVAGKVIMIDAGHGGLSMVGTATTGDSVSEAQVTLAIALKAKQYLENLGATVIMTRITDSSLSLSERTELCEKYNPDIFVSIHCDGSDTLSESGTHTFYYRPYSQPLAYSIHNELVNTYKQSIYSQVDPNFEQVDRKIKYYPFYVTRVDTCPSVLIETGFLTNFVEGNVLSNPIYQDKIAHGISNGICNYFSATK